MPRIYRIESPVGAGKSTFAASLASRVGAAVHIDLRDWFTRLYSPDQPGTGLMPWYIERKARLTDHVWSHAQSRVACGIASVPERGLVERHSREDVAQRACAAEVDLTVYLFQASHAFRRERVMRGNVGTGPAFSMVVPAPFFEMASDVGEEPDDVEIAGNRTERISTDA